jgi:polar amino acid transport system permease protein
MTYHWDFGVVLRSDGLFAQGVAATLLLTVSALAIAVPLGLLLALGRMAPWWALSWTARLIIDFFRTSALFVLIIWFFFAFPILFRLQVNAFQAATLAIGLQAGAYLAEIFRAGIESIHAGQWQAARALGLHFGATLRLVVLPQAIRHVLPVFLNLVIDTIKNTSFAAAIAYGELTYQAMRVASDTYRPLEVFTVVGALYFIIITGSSRLSAMLERRLAIELR